ncbi:DUF393 domain-containing protein [Gryllotalpicola sp.]|uniref:thiol-disulfide oxidoreductase DCC family protein n=1 Tax=Gryllotalpicola sp. TaxID=1932787 RepID=UPI0026252551|nr:DUF393 domain-containing protein [Gryllotalpicola sp.]
MTALLVFDGDCGFCTSAVDWLKRVLPAAPAAVPYQWADLAALGLTAAEAGARVWLVEGAQRYGGSRAVAELLRRQPDARWRLLGWLAAVPPWSWAAGLGYRLVARYRYLLPGGTPACRAKRA